MATSGVLIVFISLHCFKSILKAHKSLNFVFPLSPPNTIKSFLIIVAPALALLHGLLLESVFDNYFQLFFSNS